MWTHTHTHTRPLVLALALSKQLVVAMETSRGVKSAPTVRGEPEVIQS